MIYLSCECWFSLMTKKMSDNWAVIRLILRKEDEDNSREDAVALFDMLPIEDSRIHDLSARAGQPSPYLLLQVSVYSGSHFVSCLSSLQYVTVDNIVVSRRERFARVSTICLSI